MAIAGPKDRGFSYVEAWMCGVQSAVLFALIEYGFILALHKYGQINKLNIGKMVKIVDTVSIFFALITFVTFYVFFWHV